MTNLLEKIIAVLGKSPDDPLFGALSVQLAEDPEILCKTKHGCVYRFPNSGIEFNYYEHCQCLASVFFHHGSAMAESGQLERYTGDLPAEICWGDSTSEIRKKLGLAPSLSKRIKGRTPDAEKDLWEEYGVSPLLFRCIFRGNSDQLASMSIEHSACSLPR